MMSSIPLRSEKFYRERKYETKLKNKSLKSNNSGEYNNTMLSDQYAKNEIKLLNTVIKTTQHPNCGKNKQNTK